MGGIHRKSFSFYKMAKVWQSWALGLIGDNHRISANMVESQSGKIVRLDPKNPIQRESVAKRLMTPEEVTNGDFSELKKVHRHLCNNDILLLNRQPSLHKPSVMAHKARILKGEKTFRLHYANCKAYNADFDGDEMNAHFPQGEVARSEAYNLANVSNQYLVPKDGTPLSGLIQDHVIAGVKLSVRGSFFCKADYDHLVFQGLYQKTREIKVLPPTILKPVRLWSGKQVISTIIMNIIPDGKELINLTSQSKIKSKDWQSCPYQSWKACDPFEDELEMSESRVIIRKGELLTGVLDKAQYGATPYGLIHCMYELYGGACATEMLSSLSRVFTGYLQTRGGFTLGVRDILTEAAADRKRKKIINKLREVGPAVMRKALNLPDDATNDEILETLSVKLKENPNFTAIIDREYKSTLNNFTNKMNSACMSGLVSKFPENNLQLMVKSGAKGTTVNTMQISCCLGQIELEGKRPPKMISGKSLPSFPEFEFSPRAGGFIEGRFLTGIPPQEFFFHCMAGREGLVDTAVKTSRSGYLQRCLIKSLEGLQVKHDMTVRDSDNTVVQFLYGHDGMDIGKSQFFSKEQLPFLHENMHAILDKKFVKSESKSERGKEVKLEAKKIKEWKMENGCTFSGRRPQPFTLFTKFFNENSNRKATKEQLIQLWGEAGEEVRQSFIDKCRPCPDPLNATYFPQSSFGSVSEKVQDLIDGYDGCKTKKEKKTFDNMMKQKAMASLCESGEAVGVLAAQSIGEPSTQMTLNTFHFAGRGEMNVTLGIPRLREILMMASKNIKTPAMTIPFLPIENLKEESETLRKKFNRVTVSDVLREIKVNILTLGNTRKVYTLKFEFLRHTAYENNFSVNPKYIIKHMRKKFFKLMFKEMARHHNQKQESFIDGSKSKSNTTAWFGEDDGEDEKMEVDADEPCADSSDEEPEDETDAKSARKYQDLHDDQEADEEDVEMADAENEDDEEENTPVTDTVDDETSAFLDQYSNVDKLTYDKKHYLWCEIVFWFPVETRMALTTVMKDIAAKSVIWEVPGIKRAFTQLKDGVMTLTTDGINIPEMSKYDRILDLNKLYCNDIHKMIEHRGVDAGAAAIVKEIESVFEVYGIKIDPRHLRLIADFMTTQGVFLPLNRTGMRSSINPFQQMSFEASLQFLKDAVIGGKKDPLKNPSSALTAGVLCDIGTGTFGLVQKII